MDNREKAEADQVCEECRAVLPYVCITPVCDSCLTKKVVAKRADIQGTSLTLGTIALTAPDGSPAGDVPALICGPLACNVTPRNELWAVTHIASGLLVKSFGHWDEAVALAVRLSGEDWSPEALSDVNRKAALGDKESSSDNRCAAGDSVLVHVLSVASGKKLVYQVIAECEPRYSAAFIETVAAEEVPRG